MSEGAAAAAGDVTHTDADTERCTGKGVRVVYSAGNKSEITWEACSYK